MDNAHIIPCTSVLLADHRATALPSSGLVIEALGQYYQVRAMWPPRKESKSCALPECIVLKIITKTTKLQLLLFWSADRKFEVRFQCSVYVN